MKTKISTLIALIALFFLASFPAHAADGTTGATIIAEASNFSKIEVHGNVTVYLSAGAANEVKVYDNYYSKNALIQNENGTLRITSYNTKKLVLWVTAAELRGLTVYDNAQVESVGKFNSLSLDLNLYNRAIVRLDMDVIQANLNVSNAARADLKGTVMDCVLKQDHFATLNNKMLTAEHLVYNVEFFGPRHHRKPEPPRPMFI